jgi:hypothetical protein
MMFKPPEQGEIWEWRAFGNVSDELAFRIRQHPIRMGVLDNQGEDLYLVSPVNDQNIKLRRLGVDWALKIKLLLRTGERGMELYSESAGMMFSFPVPAQILETLTRLLGTNLPSALTFGDSISRDELVSALTKSTPSILVVRVAKTRSQFDFGRGWVELAEVNFPAQRVQSLSIHSFDSRRVEEILNELQPDTDLHTMNYVQACRRWQQ